MRTVYSTPRGRTGLLSSLLAEQSITCGAEADANGSWLGFLLLLAHVLSLLACNPQSSSFNHLGRFPTFYRVLSVRRQGLPSGFGNIQYIQTCHTARVLHCLPPCLSPRWSVGARPKVDLSLNSNLRSHLKRIPHRLPIAKTRRVMNAEWPIANDR